MSAYLFTWLLFNASCPFSSLSCLFRAHILALACSLSFVNLTSACSFSTCMRKKHSHKCQIKHLVYLFVIFSLGKPTPWAVFQCWRAGCPSLESAPSAEPPAVRSGPASPGLLLRSPSPPAMLQHQAGAEVLDHPATKTTFKNYRGLCRWLITAFQPHVNIKFTLFSKCML